MFRDESFYLPDVPPELFQQVVVKVMQSAPVDSAMATGAVPDSRSSMRRKRQREEDESDEEGSGTGEGSVQKRARTEHGWTEDAQPEASSSRVQLAPLLAYPDLAAGTPASVWQRQPILTPARWDQTPGDDTRDGSAG